MYNRTPFRVDSRGSNVIREDLIQANENFSIIDDRLNSILSLIQTSQNNNDIQSQIQQLQQTDNNILSQIQQLQQTDNNLQSQIEQLQQNCCNNQNNNNQNSNQTLIDLANLSQPINFNIKDEGFVIIPETGDISIRLNILLQGNEVFMFIVIPYTKNNTTGNVSLLLLPNNTTSNCTFWYSGVGGRGANGANGLYLTAMAGLNKAVGIISIPANITGSETTYIHSNHGIIDERLYSRINDNIQWSELGTLSFNNTTNTKFLFYIKRIY